MKLRVRWGCKPKTWNSRRTVDFEIPLASARLPTVQCVPLGGLASTVSASAKAATCSSSMLRGRPGRTSSYSPAKRRCTKRWRQMPTVALAQCTRRAIWLLLWPAPTTAPAGPGPPRHEAGYPNGANYGAGFVRLLSKRGVFSVAGHHECSLPTPPHSTVNVPHGQRLRMSVGLRAANYLSPRESCCLP